MTSYTNHSLLPHNTFGIRVFAQQFIEYASEEELRKVLYTLNHPDEGKVHPLLHIGGGSNLLFTKDFQGVVLHSAIKGIEPISFNSEQVYLRVGAGEVWDDFVAYCVEHDLCGAENLSLIPGEVGASAIQNIGAYGAEAKDLIVQVEAIDLKTGQSRTFEVDECQYAYRQSVFKNELRGRYAVTHVTYRLSKVFTPRLDYGGIRAELEKETYQGIITLQTIRQAIIAIRQAKLPDPKVLGNGGSFFMNPVVDRSKYNSLAAQYAGMPHYEIDADHVKIPVGWMIEQCGWKGRRMGEAGVHDKQALILVNYGQATGADIIALSDAIRHDVLEKFGIEIYPEVNFI